MTLGTEGGKNGVGWGRGKKREKQIKSLSEGNGSHRDRAGDRRWAARSRVTALGHGSEVLAASLRTGAGSVACPVCPPPGVSSCPGGRKAPPRRPSSHSFQQCRPCQSFFFSKWGTIPLSSGLGLPGPSVSFRPSSASWDKYFCGRERGTKEEGRRSVATWQERTDGLCALPPAVILPSG